MKLCRERVFWTCVCLGLGVERQGVFLPVGMGGDSEGNH